MTRTHRPRTIGTLAVLGIMATIASLPADVSPEWPQLTRQGPHLPYAWEWDATPTMIAETEAPAPAMPAPVAAPPTVPPPPVAKPTPRKAAPKPPATVMPPSPPASVAIVTHYSMRNRAVARQVSQD